MADVVGRGVIELVADARKLKAGIEEAKKATRTLGEGQREISKSAQRSIDAYIGRLQVQNATLGKSVRETELYKLAARGASNEQLNLADSVLRSIERQKRWNQAADESVVIIRRLTLAAVAAATAYAALTLRNANFADRLLDLSKSTNLSVEDLAGLALVAKQGGTDIEGLAKAINRMTVEMGKAPQEFRELGISASEPLEAFGQFADLFNQLPDINQRNALAQRVFSRSWQELAPILAEGSKRIAEITERGRQLSGINKENAEIASDFNDRMDELKITMQALGREAIPTLNGIARAMVDARRDGEGFFATLQAGAKQAFQDLFRLNNAGDLNRVSKQIFEIAERILDLENGRGGVSNERRQQVIAGLKAELAELQRKRDVLEGVAALERRSGQQANQSAAAARKAQEEAKAKEAEAKAASARAAAFLKEGAEQIKLVREVAAERVAAAERSIALELELTRARLSTNANLLSSQRGIERAELDAIAKRVKAAQDAHRVEQNIIRTSNITARQAAEEQLKAGNKLYDTLIARNNEYLRIFSQNQAKLIALDDQLQDSRKQTGDFVKEIEREGFTAAQRRDAAIREAFENEAKLRDAVLSGNIEKQKELAQEALRAAQNIRQLGDSDGARRIAEEAQRLRELGIEFQRTAASSTAKAAEQGAKSIQQKIKELDDQLKKLSLSALGELKIGASQESLSGLVQSIREAIEKETFNIKLQPQIGTQPLPISGNAYGGLIGMASGGKVPGSSPHSRADNILVAATAGEYMVQQPAVAHYGTALLDAINNMRLPKFAEGGQVGGGATVAAHDVIDINLHRGGKTVTVQTKRDQAAALVDILKDAMAGT